MKEDLNFQESILNGEKTDKNSANYKNLFNALSKSDSVSQLSPEFNRTVVKRLEKRNVQLRAEKFIIGMAVSILGIVALITFLIVGGESALKSINGVHWYAIIFIVMLGCFRAIERKFLKQT